MKHTPEAIEAQSAELRAQLVVVGEDIRHRADPLVVVDAAKESFKRRLEEAPVYLKESATPISMVLLGGALALAMTGMFSRSRPDALPRAGLEAEASHVIRSAQDESRPTVKSHIRAALLSGTGLGLGYLAGMFVPATTAEDRFLREPKAMLSEHLNQFANRNAEGMKSSIANAFGVSRMSGTILVGIALLAEALGIVAAVDQKDAA